MGVAMMKRPELVLLIIDLSLICFSSGSWFFLQSEPILTNDHDGVTISGNYPIGESSVVTCALRCTLANNACMFAAISSSLKCHCSLLSDEENVMARTEPDMQIFQRKDFDECSLGMSSCHETAICTNTIASFTCSCPAGYAGDGITECSNIDECVKGTAKCHNYAACTDTEGSYACKCKPGFQGDGKRICSNINECTKDTHNCSRYSARCADKLGSFSCHCKSGFIGNGNTCRAPLGIHFSRHASSVPNSHIPVTQHSELSVCLWVNYLAAGSIVKVWYEPSQDQCFTLSICIDPSLSSIHVSGSGFIPTKLPTAGDVWHHLCAMRSTTVQSLYLDKVEYFVRRDPYPEIPESLLHISLGNPENGPDNASCPGNNGVNSFLGTIKDVFVWTAMLTVEEVKLVYEGSDFPNKHRWITWMGAFNKQGLYPEQVRVSFTSEQLDEIHANKNTS